MATTAITTYEGARVVALATPGSNQVIIRFVTVPAGRPIADATVSADTADEVAETIRKMAAIARQAG